MDQVCATKEFSATARQSILVLKTSIGHERNVADGVSSKAKTGNTGIFAILAPGKLDGYVFMEAMNTDLVREIVRGVRKAKGLVEGETSFNEIEHFLTPKPLVSGISEGDVVELVAGPFKGEKARVQKIDEAKKRSPSSCSRRPFRYRSPSGATTLEFSRRRSEYNARYY